MSYVFDRNGKTKQVPADYVLQPGESLQIPLMMRDAAPTGGRITLIDSAPKIAIGDAVMTDSIGGLERITFADGTTAVKQPQGNWRYFAINGQGGFAPTVHQQAHDARMRGESLRQFADGHIEREGNRLAARSAYESGLANAWRG